MYCSQLSRKYKICTGITGLTGLFILVSGLLLGPLVNKKIDEKLKKMMPLVKGTVTYNYWIDPPIPIHFQFHFFHVVNPKEVVENGAKPAVEERGPYTYRLLDKKENLVHHDDYKVSYNEREIFLFQRDLSVGDENETFTTLNLPLITATTLLRYEKSYIQEISKLFFEFTQDADLFITLSVKELIWGYTDPMMAEAKKFFDMIGAPFNDHFGFFYQLNNSIANNYTVFTGEGDLQKISKYTTWNGLSTLPYWTTDTCNMINGSDGNLFHPRIKEDDKLFIFFSQVCRSFYISFESKGQFKGIDYVRFVLRDEIFNDVEKNPANDGFCTPQSNCLPSGLLNATTCRKGSPVVMSQPHFLGADKSVIDAFDGIHPNKELHETFVDIVALTGTLVRTQRTTQINMFIEKTPFIRQTANIDHFYFPVMYIKEVAGLTDSFAKTLKDELQTPLNVVYYTRYCCIGLGSLILCVLICILIRTKVSQKNENYKDTNNVDEQTKLLSNGDTQRTNEHVVNGDIQRTNEHVSNGHVQYDNR